MGATGFAAEKGLASGFAKGRSLASAADPRGEAAMGERLADVMLLLRDFFNKRPASTVLGCFRAQDFDRSGKFELREFALALKAFGFQMSDGDYELVFNWFDKDGSVTLTLTLTLALALTLTLTRTLTLTLTLTLALALTLTRTRTRTRTRTLASSPPTARTRRCYTTWSSACMCCGTWSSLTRTRT